MASQCYTLPGEVLYWTNNIFQAVPTIFLLFCPGTWELGIYWGTLLSTNCNCMTVGLTILVALKTSKSILPVIKSFCWECRVCLFGQCTFLYSVCSHTVKTENAIDRGVIMKPWKLLEPPSLKMEGSTWQFLNCNVFGVRLVWPGLNVQNIFSSTLFLIAGILTATRPAAISNWISFLRNKSQYTFDQSLETTANTYTHW